MPWPKPFSRGAALRISGRLFRVQPTRAAEAETWSFVKLFAPPCGYEPPFVSGSHMLDAVTQLDKRMLIKLVKIQGMGLY